MSPFTFDNDVVQCLSVLKRGGTILYPTDTIWGIGCDATNAEAVEKIIVLKKRPEHKSFVVLVADEKDILQYVAAPDLAVFDYIAQLAKPVTVIYEHALGLADNVLAADGSVAIRICKDAFCKHLIRRFRKPIVSTSANFSNEASPVNFKGIHTEIINSADYTVQYRREENAAGAASSIIKWVRGQATVIRP